MKDVISKTKSLRITLALYPFLSINPYILISMSICIYVSIYFSVFISIISLFLFSLSLYTFLSEALVNFLIPYLGIILRILESRISTSNLPKTWKMYLRRYWPKRQPGLTESPTGIDQITNGY